MIYFEHVIPSMKINSLLTQFGTPLRIAKSKGHDHIVQLLREANKGRVTLHKHLIDTHTCVYTGI